MPVSQRIRKKVRSGRVMKSEPQDLELINEDLIIRASFEKFGCMRFYERIKGYNVNLVEQFTLNFTGVSMTIVGITFRVIEETFSAATEIPSHG
jgi:hypothetical protein